MESAAVELADLMKLICKTFWSTTYLDIPQHLLQPPVFMAWMAAFEELVLKPVPLVILISPQYRVLYDVPILLPLLRCADMFKAL